MDECAYMHQIYFKHMEIYRIYMYIYICIYAYIYIVIDRPTIHRSCK